MDKRFVAGLASLLLLCRPAFAAIAYITHSSGLSQSGSPDSAVTSAVDATGVTFICGVVSYLIPMYGGDPSGVAVNDNYGNSYTLYTAYLASTGYVLAYSTSGTIATGSNFVITITGASGGAIYAATAWEGFSGILTATPHDQENGNGTAGTYSTFNAGSITPSYNNEVVVAGLDLTGTSASIDSSFNQTDTQPFNSAQNYGISIAYLIQTTATAENPTWSISGLPNTEIAADIESFRASSTGHIQSVNSVPAAHVNNVNGVPFSHLQNLWGVIK